MTTIAKRVKDVVVREFHVQENELQADTKFRDDLGFDDYDYSMLLLALENEFGLCFWREEEAPIEEMNDAIELVQVQTARRRYTGLRLAS